MKQQIPVIRDMSKAYDESLYRSQRFNIAMMQSPKVVGAVTAFFKEGKSALTAYTNSLASTNGVWNQSAKYVENLASKLGPTGKIIESNGKLYNEYSKFIGMSANATKEQAMQMSKMLTAAERQRFGIDKLADTTNKNEKTTRKATKAYSDASKATADLGKQHSIMDRSVRKGEQGFSMWIKGIAAGMLAYRGIMMVINALSAAMKAPFTAAMDFEHAFANIRKTLEATEPEFQASGDRRPTTSRGPDRTYTRGVTEARRRRSPGRSAEPADGQVERGGAGGSLERRKTQQPAASHRC